MATTQRRKLLTAAVGVATVSYMMACGKVDGGATSGNLVAAGGFSNETGGSGGAGSATGAAAYGGANPGTAGSYTSGNLVAPPPGCCPPFEPVVDGGAADTGVPSGDAAAAPDADAAPGEEDSGVDSGP